VNETISVIIPSYQHAPTLGACVDSILAQTRKPDEIIVVDDGSTDDTQAVLAPYRERGVRVITQQNAGSNPARMAGFAASTGERIMFCDADAVMRPDALEKLSAALDAHPEASYAYSSFRFGWKQFEGIPFDAAKLRTANYIHTSSLIRREHFPGFDPAIRRLQDWDLWLTMSEAGHVGIFVPEELFRIIDVRGRAGISQWLPSIAYKIPWKRLGWVPRSVAKYEAAKEQVMKKHDL
jgi:glycosyltransferase involved in cell wall biosynthesis